MKRFMYLQFAITFLWLKTKQKQNKKNGSSTFTLFSEKKN